LFENGKDDSEGWHEGPWLREHSQVDAVASQLEITSDGAAELSALVRFRRSTLVDGQVTVLACVWSGRHLIGHPPQVYLHKARFS